MITNPSAVIQNEMTSFDLKKYVFMLVVNVVNVCIRTACGKRCSCKAKQLSCTGRCKSFQNERDCF